MEIGERSYVVKKNLRVREGEEDGQRNKGEDDPGFSESDEDVGVGF